MVLIGIRHLLPDFIRDLRPAALNKLYYMYIFLPEPNLKLRKAVAGM